MVRVTIAVLFVSIWTTTAIAQDRASVEEILKAFQAERTDAIKTFPAAELAVADELAARAEAARKAGNLEAALRYAREARWQLPFLPTNLPPHVVRVLGMARLRHADRVNALTYSPDGSRLASASRDGTIKVWDLGNGREILTYRGHGDGAPADVEKSNVLRVPGVAFRPDGKAIASSGGKEIHVWDAATGKRIQTLTGHTQPARGLAFGTDPNILVSGGDDRRVIVWDIAAGKPLTIYPEQSRRVEAVSIGGKGKLVASINDGGELFVYPLVEGKQTPLLSIPVTDGGQAGFGVAFAGESNSVLTCGGDSRAKLIAGPEPSSKTSGSGTTIRTYQGHTEKLNSLAATADGKLMITGSNDRTVRIWEVATGKLLFTFPGHTAWVTAIAIRPDGRQAASGAEDGSIRVWPLAATDEHKSFTEATDSIWSLAVAPDGKRFAAAGADRSIRVYLGQGKLEKTLTGHTGAIPSLAFVSSSALASASGDKLVKIWDLDAGTSRDLTGHTGAVLAVAADAGGKVLVSGSVDRTVRGWDVSSGKALWTWSGKSAVCAVAVRLDGQRVAIGTADGWLTILAVMADGDPKVVGLVNAHGAGVAGVAFHPEGGQVATCGGDGIVRIWTVPDSTAPTLLGKLEPPGRGGRTTPISALTAVAYSVDGRLIAFAGADAVTRVWDAQAGTELRGLRGHTDWVTTVAFLPDGKSVLSAGVDHSIRLFELPRPETSATHAGHTLPVRGVAVSRDGRLAATASEDRTIKVWDLSTGQEVANLTGSTEPINALGFAGPNEIASAGDDGRVRWWTVNPAREVRTAPSGKVFNLAVTADSRVAVVWTRRNEKHSGFEVFSPQGASTIQVAEKGRDLTCAVLSSDGTLAVSGGEDGVVRIWDLAAKDRLGADWPIFSGAVADLALTPDKQHLIAIDGNGTVKVGDVAKRSTGEPIKAVTNGVQGLVVSPSGDRFATLSVAGDVKVWNFTGKELRAWKLPAAAAAAAFTPDGKRLVTGNRDGTAYVLELP